MLWILIGVLIIGLLYWQLIYPFYYWEKNGIKQVKPLQSFRENFQLILRKETVVDMVLRIYNQFPKDRFSGMYSYFTPMLLIKDPDLIKQLTVKDFDHFTDHMSFMPDDFEPLWTRNLFALKGDKWKDMRSTLSPAFTSSKMRTMFSLISECSEQFANFFLQNKNTSEVELKDTFTRFTNDVIATCAFGIKCDSLKERENEFYVMGKDATNFKGFWKILRFVVILVAPKISKILGFTIFSKQVAKFFKTLVEDTVKLREEKNIIRPDMIHLLMEAKKGRLSYEENREESKGTGFATVEESDIGKVIKKQKEEITLDDMTAQALIFFFAGFDSVSSLMCFMGYELAINPDIQERLYQEIKETLESCNGKLSYEAVNKMKYMDMVISESLRKWPPGIALDRRCTIPYTIKAKHEGEVDVHLKKGDLIWIPTWGFHHDPQYFPNPSKFDPERFSEENKGNINPYAYFPFGVGPRNCIGSRFALLETKTVFIHLLSTMEFCVIEKTQIPLQFSKGDFNLSTEKGFWVGLKPRKI